jgi:GT2 family glycosyltransferase
MTNASVNMAVVVLNYNDTPTTVQFIQNHLPIDVIDRFIVIDNASTDDSLVHLKALESNRIVVLLTPKNGGYACGNNVGLRYAHDVLHAKNVLLANPDTRIDKVTLLACLEFLDKKPNVGLVAPLMMTPQGIERSAWKLPHYGDLLLRSLIPLRFLFNRQSIPKREVQGVQAVDVVAGSLWLARTDVLADVDYFDESTFLYGEEQILAYKLKSKGYISYQWLSGTYDHQHSQSINKSIQSTRTKFEIALQSHQIYLKNYLKVSRWAMGVYTASYRINLALFLGIKRVQSIVRR